MKSLLIVEDEKMIRQGIVTMAKRSPVEIQEILECRNGAEALEILRSRTVEVMFTDIRMPKMDGIELIRHLKELPNPPKTIVVSGYDDFSYAVEAMKGGVKDYILKPIEREKVFELLVKLDEELKKEQQDQKIHRKLNRQQLRYVISNTRLPEQELDELEEQYGEEGAYVLCCSSCSRLLEQEEGFEQLSEVQGQSVFIVDAEIAEHFLETGGLSAYCVGVSQRHIGVREIRGAYEEALEARKIAFVKEKHRVAWEECAEAGKEHIPENFVEQFVQMFGTDKVQTAINKLENYYFQAKRGNMDSGELMKATMAILEQILVTYKNVLELDMPGYVKLRQPLSYDRASVFLEEFRGWLLQMKELIAAEFSDHKNKEKINMAVAYIRENYDKELNMAIVSNYISMNYSLFSLSFKQYTGMNFVNYLKMIRIGEAKRLLEETDEKVIDISQRVGYENEKHFMKTFKSICGVSPSEYRKNMQLKKN